MKRGRPKDIEKIMLEGTLVDAALNAAVREAVLMHKRAGNPIAEWRDGKVVWIAPEDIHLDDEPAPRVRRRRRTAS
jgi:hypothetical protein